MVKMRGKKPYKTKKKTNNKTVKVNNSNYFIFSFFSVITLNVNRLNAHQKRFAEWGKKHDFFSSTIYETVFRSKDMQKLKIKD